TLTNLITYTTLFRSLNLIHKEAHKNLAMPEGKEHFKEGFEKTNVPSISELLEMAQEMGVKMIGCQMTMDVMNLEKDDFVEGIERSEEHTSELQSRFD